jgi:hypothetical protein
MRATLLTVIAASAFGCSSLRTGLVKPLGIDMTRVEVREVQQAFNERTVVLATALNTAPFFGDAGRRFADNRSIDRIFVTNRSGERLKVPAFNGPRVPVGTPVRVESVIFPKASLLGVLEDRSSSEPNAHVWVVLKRLDRRDTPLVIVLPGNIQDADGVREHLQEFLASPEWFAQWMATRSPEVRAAIERKAIVPGMSRAELYAAVGRPFNYRDLDGAALHAVAEYGDQRVTLRGDRVMDTPQIIDTRAIASAEDVPGPASIKEDAPGPTVKKGKKAGKNRHKARRRARRKT